jgi:hypothetical protein
MPITITKNDVLIVGHGNMGDQMDTVSIPANTPLLIVAPPGAGIRKTLVTEMLAGKRVDILIMYNYDAKPGDEVEKYQKINQCSSDSGSVQIPSFNLAPLSPQENAMLTNAIEQGSLKGGGGPLVLQTQEMTTLKDLLSSKKNDIADHVRSHHGARILWLACANLEKGDDDNVGLSLFGNVPAAVRFIRSQGSKEMSTMMAAVKNVGAVKAMTDAAAAGKSPDDIEKVTETAKQIEKENKTMEELIAILSTTKYGAELVHKLNDYCLLPH